MTEADNLWAHAKLKWLLGEFLKDLEDGRTEVTFLMTADLDLRKQAAAAVREWL